MRARIILVALITFAGLFILSQGLSGMVVSQTCCFPPNCAPENRCTFSESNPEQSVMIGSTLFFLPLIYIAIHQKHIR